MKNFHCEDWGDYKVGKYCNRIRNGGLEEQLFCFSCINYDKGSGFGCDGCELMKRKKRNCTTSAADDDTYNTLLQLFNLKLMLEHFVIHRTSTAI